ncbi:MAG: RusA family crossover junction endodeoxyribonuclease [Inconstantimicrobium porci]|uniref:RusA family crossover junction endodeoxyribonuclease n=1 Tax=Inconstantimicrobium porci TaxID=2652291 RepID=A0A7X2MXP0_9CLOT|nr:RusA family crossover junction endodeoxyribonuclease [Inconstantimicrobium porci]MDD6770823.1 RusA family crossover junction endodeoxyribonuclease [Inconstantimicrobium porci]MDY5911043.1 RusA family crossover junction endodeoxyribonuclease [Inconstantimicrobium porci]MSR90955.1 RusA family crossover junction endodeoxyribonuclease [Inconstantimicrobium porci]
MNSNYAKIIVKGSPITKSNFKLFNAQGRAILPKNSGLYHDRYAIYEEQIALEARAQNPNVIFTESLIAVLKVYYKSEKRHPDTINITKSIFDGIEKSGIIINDVQIRKIITEEYYDKENPRFELELYAESCYSLDFSIKEKEIKGTPVIFKPSINSQQKNVKKTPSQKTSASSTNVCAICSKPLKEGDYISADNGKTLICKSCFKKAF